MEADHIADCRYSKNCDYPILGSLALRSFRNVSLIFVLVWTPLYENLQKSPLHILHTLWKRKKEIYFNIFNTSEFDIAFVKGIYTTLFVASPHSCIIMYCIYISLTLTSAYTSHCLSQTSHILIISTSFNYYIIRLGDCKQEESINNKTEVVKDWDWHDCKFIISRLCADLS